MGKHVKLAFHVITRFWAPTTHYAVRIMEPTTRAVLHNIEAPSYRAACDMRRALEAGYKLRGKL